MQVPTSLGAFEGRKPLPEAWAGKRGSDLAEITGISDSIFCHQFRFIAGTGSRETAIEMARMAVDA